MEQKEMDALIEKLEYKKRELNKMKKYISELDFANRNMKRLSGMSDRITAKEKQVNRKFEDSLDNPNRIRTLLKGDDELMERFFKIKERGVIENKILIDSMQDAIDYFDKVNNGMHLDRDITKNKMSTIKGNYIKLNDTLESMLQFI